MLPTYDSGGKLYTKLRMKNLIPKKEDGNRPIISISTKKDGQYNAMDLIYGKSYSEFLLTFAMTLCDMLKLKTITVPIAGVSNSLYEVLNNIDFCESKKYANVSMNKIKQVLKGSNPDMLIGNGVLKMISESRYPSGLTRLCGIFVQLLTNKTLSKRMVEGIELMTEYYDTLKDGLPRDFERNFIYQIINDVRHRVYCQSLFDPTIDETLTISPETRPVYKPPVIDIESDDDDERLVRKRKSNTKQSKIRFTDGDEIVNMSDIVLTKPPRKSKDKYGFQLIKEIEESKNRKSILKTPKKKLISLEDEEVEFPKVKPKTIIRRKRQIDTTDEPVFDKGRKQLTILEDEEYEFPKVKPKTIIRRKRQIDTTDEPVFDKGVKVRPRTEQMSKVVDRMNEQTIKNIPIELPSVKSGQTKLKSQSVKQSPQDLELYTMLRNQSDIPQDSLLQMIQQLDNEIKNAAIELINNGELNPETIITLIQPDNVSNLINKIPRKKGKSLKPTEEVPLKTDNLPPLPNLLKQFNIMYKNNPDVFNYIKKSLKYNNKILLPGVEQVIRYVSLFFKSNKFDWLKHGPVTLPGPGKYFNQQDMLKILEWCIKNNIPIIGSYLLNSGVREPSIVRMYIIYGLYNKSKLNKTVNQYFDSNSKF